MSTPRFAAACKRYGLEPATGANTDSMTWSDCELIYQSFPKLTTASETIARNHTHKPIHIDAGFCVNESINAFATFSTRNEYIIGMNTGVISRLASAYFAIFNDCPQFLSKLNILEELSLSKVRIIVDVSLFAAVNWLVSHEIGHILRGHVDFLQDRRDKKHILKRVTSFFSPTPIPVLAEARREIPSNDSVAPEFYQFLEFDADWFAGSRTIDPILHYHGLLARDLSVLIPDRRDLVRITSLAIYVLLHLLYGDEDDNLDEWKNTSHPHAEVRLYLFWNIANTSVREVTNWNVNLRALFFQDMLEIIREMPDSSVGHLAMRLVRPFELFSSERKEKDALRIVGDHDRFRKELEPFAIPLMHDWT